MKYPEFTQQLIQLRDNDMAVREQLISRGELHAGYHPEMEAVHLSNARKLESIIAEIGYPTQEKVGKEGSNAAWLIIQHAISRPDFMRSCLELIKTLDPNTVDPVHLAHLEDRIAMFEERPQLYGTQFHENADGELMVYELGDTLEVVDARRRSIGLNSIQERFAELKEQILSEGRRHRSKQEILDKQEMYRKWKRDVGWIQ